MDGMRPLCLQAIWDEHLDDVVDRVRVIEDAAVGLRAGKLEPGLICEARAAAHTLAGSVGTFGFECASCAAMSLQWELEHGCPSGPCRFDALLHSLRRGLKLDPDQFGD